MKKLYSFLAVTAIAVAANAQTVALSETFSYPDATALSTSSATTGWYQHSGTQGQITVNGGQASLVAGNTEDINKALATPYALGPNGAFKVVVTSTVTVLNSTGLTTTGDYFLSLAGTVTTSNVTTGITSLPARVFVKAGTSGVLFGVVNNSGGSTAANYVTTEVPYGTPTAITMTYEVTKDAAGTVILQQASLQVGTETITNTTGSSAPPANIAGVALRQAGSATSGTGNINVDNVNVTTYAVVLGVADFKPSNSYFVRNTFVNDELKFGTKSDVKVYNMNGQVVKSASVSENKNLFVDDLKPGMYIVTGTVNGEAVSQKILKK